MVTPGYERLSYDKLCQALNLPPSVTFTLYHGEIRSIPEGTSLKGSIMLCPQLYHQSKSLFHVVGLPVHVLPSAIQGKETIWKK
ncbi:hypothetical protein WN943_001283 [Citrus x changshan-huyou]